MNTNFSRIGLNLFWSYYDTVDGRITWAGREEDFWWQNYATTQDFQVQVGWSGRKYRLDPVVGEVTVIDDLNKMPDKVTITITDRKNRTIVLEVDDLHVNVHRGLQTVNDSFCKVREPNGQEIVEILGWSGLKNPKSFITDDEALRRRLTAGL